MSKQKPYDEYKESGIKWVGPIPAGWETRPLFAVARANTASNKAGAEANLLSLSYGRIVRKDIAGNDGLLPASFDTYQVIGRHDIVLRLTDLQNDKRSLRSAISPERGIITSAYLALTPTTILPRFLSYLLRAYDLQKVFYSMGGGLRQSMKFSDMKWLPVILPPESTQREVIAYLDRETAQINELIGKQERLIELLAEKRQAIITHAVTKGLNPNAATKPSGIPWLGDVPAHWSVRKFSQVTSINGGQVDPRQEPWANMLLIAPNHVESGTGRITHRETSAEQGADSGKYLVKAGEVIYSKIRPYLRKVVIAPEDCLCSADMYGISALPSAMSNRFLQELMLSQPFTDFTADSSARVAMPKINREALARGFLWYPPLSEQEAILGYIDRESALTDQLEKRSRKFIALLRERRSALIAAAVTGKIDVTNEGVAA